MPKMIISERLYPLGFSLFYPKSYSAVKCIIPYINPYSNRGDIEPLKIELLSRILNHATKTVPFYNSLIIDKFLLYDPFGFLKRLPIISKGDLKTEKLKFISSDKSYSCKTFNTGGSTGSPFEFYFSKASGMADYFHQRAFYFTNDYSPGDKILSFDGIPIPEFLTKEKIFWKRRGIFELPYGKIHISSHYLSDETYTFYRDFFFREKPRFLRGYPSVLYEFAVRLEKEEMKTDFLKSITLTAEEIFPYQIDKLRHVFNCNVFGQYGHSEAAIYALTQPNDLTYYCSPLYGYTEVLNATNEHVKIDEEGDIVVTGYFNFNLPFIRYKTGDRAIYGGEQGGSVILKRISGRQQDFVIDKEGNKISITGLVFGQHIRAFGVIRKWQIHQIQKGNITINIVPEKQLGESDISEIIQKLSLGNKINVTVSIVDDIRKTSRGKQLFVVNELLIPTAKNY